MLADFLTEGQVAEARLLWRGGANLGEIADALGLDTEGRQVTAYYLSPWLYMEAGIDDRPAPFDPMFDEILQVYEEFDGWHVACGAVASREIVGKAGPFRTEEGAQLWARRRRPPRGIFPRDGAEFAVHYNRDFCPQDSRERRAFLDFLKAELHGMAFTSFVHVWRAPRPTFPRGGVGSER